MLNLENLTNVDIPQRVFDRAHKQEKINGGAIIYDNKLLVEYTVYAPRNIRSGMEKFTCIITVYGEGMIFGYGEASGCGYDKRSFSIINACKSISLPIEWHSFPLNDIANALGLETEHDKICFVCF